MSGQVPPVHYVVEAMLELCSILARTPCGTHCAHISGFRTDVVPRGRLYWILTPQPLITLSHPAAAPSYTAAVVICEEPAGGFVCMVSPADHWLTVPLESGPK